MIEVWRGSINTWECDEMGHMNMRFYLAKAWEGMAVMAHRMNMGHAFRREHGATMRPRDVHIRYLREIRPGQPFFVRAGIVSTGEDDAEFCFEVIHAPEGPLAATVRMRVDHVDRVNGRRFPWARSIAATFDGLMAAPDEERGPRSVDWAAAPRAGETVSLEEVERQGIAVIGRGAFQSIDAGIHDVIRPHAIMGRISDCVPNLMAKWRSESAGAQGVRQVGGVLLETRIVFRRWPRPGDLFQIHTAVRDVQPRTHHFIHWMLDPVSGRPWMTMQACAAAFDLEARKLIEIGDGHLQALKDAAPGDLSV